MFSIQDHSYNLLNQFIVRELSEEEKEEIVVSEDFHKFFDRTSRIIERALDEEIDYFIDYTGASGEDGDKYVSFVHSFSKYENVVI